MLLEQLDTLAKEKIYEKNFIQQEKIGQGGFASVYRVVHRIDDAEYAVKQIHLKIREVKDDLQKHYEKLIREAKYLAQVNHPNVIRYYQSWVQVTEKKKHQKQAEQKRQTMELSSTSFSKKHPNRSKENSIASDQNHPAPNSIEPSKHLPASPSPNQLSITSHNKQPNLSSHHKHQHSAQPLDQRALKQQLEKEQKQQKPAVSDTLSTQKELEKQLTKKHEKSNYSPKHASQEDLKPPQRQPEQSKHDDKQLNNSSLQAIAQKEEPPIQDSNLAEKDTKSKKQKKDKSGARKAFIEEEEDIDNNEDSNTFYFDYDNDNGVVFVEDDDEDDDEDEEDEEEDEEDEDEDEEEEEKGDEQEQEQVDHDEEDQTNSQDASSEISHNDNDEDDNEANNANEREMDKNISFEETDEQKKSYSIDSNVHKKHENEHHNPNKTPNLNHLKTQKKELQDQNQLTQISSSSAESPLKRSNSSNPITKNQSEFQLVFESHEDQIVDELFPTRFDRGSSSNEDSQRANPKPTSSEQPSINRQRSNTNIPLTAIGRHKDSPQKSLKPSAAAALPTQANPPLRLQVSEHENSNNNQLPVSSTKSYERRKNKSVDYLTIGQKQRESQLDLYDEIIFYLQTELCSTTLAEYLTNRNKKIFSSLASSTSSSQVSAQNVTNTSSLVLGASSSSAVAPTQLSQQLSISQQQQLQQRQMILAAPIPTYKSMAGAGQLLKKNGIGMIASAGMTSIIRTVSPSPDLVDALSPEQKSEAIRLLKEIIKGLWHIHHVCKMVHRDLKPHNIFLTESLQVKIGDFGLVKKLSKLINPSASVQYNDHQLAKKAAASVSGSVQKLLMSITNNSLSIASTSPSESNSAVHDRLPFYLPKEEITSTCGTATYASPEQLSQKVEFFDHRADIYSLGIIILQLFHPMNTTMELVKTIKNCKVGDLPKQFCIRYPQLAEIIKDSLSNDPQKRPLLSTIESTLAEMEMIEGTLQSEDLGRLSLTFEDDPTPVQRYGKVIRNALYLYKTQISEKAEYMYNLKECSIRLLSVASSSSSQSSSSSSAQTNEFPESLVLAHPIQQNLILKASTLEKTQTLFEALQKNAHF